VFRHLIFFTALAIPGVAQETRVLSSVKGMVITSEALAGNHLIVSLIESTNHNPLSRSYVGADGSFEFRDVPAGSYTVELGTSGEDPIERQSVSLRASGDQIEIRLQGRENRHLRGGTVSVGQLQHPLSAKSKKIMLAAQKASEAGDYLKAVGILRSALNDASAEPYARTNIGVAYLKAGQAALAVPELQQAVRLLPDDAVARTNFAFALLLTKHVDAAEVECRRALQLDRNSSKAHWVMGSILLNKGSHEEEAVEDLRFASREMPRAKVVLAQFYERSGQKDAAARELREFLPQASGEDRAKVERWLSNLAAK
jgi:thioredoxin-like negative regulator of GroEL